MNSSEYLPQTGGNNSDLPLAFKGDRNHPENTKLLEQRGDTSFSPTGGKPYNSTATSSLGLRNFHGTSSS